MQALVLSDIGRFDLVALDDPVPGPGEVRIAVTQSGICGSELGGFLGTDGLRRPGLVFGHELVGAVDAYGPGVPVEHRLPPGALVTANPLRSCRTCAICAAGHGNVCPQRQLLGGHVHGSNAGLVVVPVSAVHRVDQLPDPGSSVFAEPTACALRAVGRTRILAGGSALVLGAGPIGLLLLEVLRARGVEQLFFTERVEGRVAAGEASGATRLSDDPAELVRQTKELTGGLGADAVFDAVGSADTRTAATLAARPGGDVCFVGLHSADGMLPLRDLIRREIVCTTSFAYSAEEFAQAVDLLGRGELVFRGEVVRAALADGQHWYEQLIKGHPVGKVVLQPSN
ncbi:alcohol dehydrogenase catalytic domain-containing protein [Kribbella sp. NPDC048915]|uniref:zinc-dependent alcohol dehydrogenase n=1 Tax=Kribbella sp. NPDC048915 TaxID=3155148 RepID=UPI0033E38BBA